MEKKRSVLFWVQSRCVLCRIIFSHSGLDIPKPDRRVDKCVREYLRTCQVKGLSDYEIVDISDIDTPRDKTVAEKAFHQRNFQTAKHSLVVKLRTRF